jgi:hypothetical protein
MRKGIRVLIFSLKDIETAANQILAGVRPVESKIKVEWFFLTSPQNRMSESYLTLIVAWDHTNLNFIILDLKVSMAAKLLHNWLIRLFYKSIWFHLLGGDIWGHQLEKSLIQRKNVLVEIEVTGLFFWRFILITECFTCNFNPHESSSIPKIGNKICMRDLYHCTFLRMQTWISNY